MKVRASKQQAGPSARAQSSPNKAYWQGLKGGRAATEFVKGQKLQAQPASTSQPPEPMQGSSFAAGDGEMCCAEENTKARA